MYQTTSTTLYDSTGEINEPHIYRKGSEFNKKKKNNTCFFVAPNIAVAAKLTLHPSDRGRFFPPSANRKSFEVTLRSKTCTQLLKTTVIYKFKRLCRKCADLCRSHGIGEAALVPPPHLWRQFGVQRFCTQRHLLSTVCDVHGWPETRRHQEVYMIAGTFSTHQVLRSTHHLTHIWTLHSGFYRGGSAG